MKITRVKLVIHDVQKMQQFYCEQMGFALVKGTEDYFTIAVGGE